MVRNRYYLIFNYLLVVDDDDDVDVDEICCVSHPVLLWYERGSFGQWFQLISY